LNQQPLYLDLELALETTIDDDNDDVMLVEVSWTAADGGR